MRKKKILIVIIVVLAVLFAGIRALYSKLAGSYEPERIAVQETDENTKEESLSGGREAASDFTFCDAGGNEFRLSDFYGKPIVLNFWADWCGPCLAELPEFNEKYNETGGDVNFIMINLLSGGDTVESVMDFAESEGYSFPVYFDKNSSGVKAYEVYYIPATYFIDRDGNIAASTVGSLDGKSLQDGISLIND